MERERKVDCPRSGPGPVWAVFVDPGPGPGPVLDLDLGSGPGPDPDPRNISFLKFYFSLTLNTKLYLLKIIYC